MSISGAILVGAPASIAVVALLLRHGAAAVLTLIAGVVAILAGERRATRALAILTMISGHSSGGRGLAQGLPPAVPDAAAEKAERPISTR